MRNNWQPWHNNFPAHPYSHSQGYQVPPSYKPFYDYSFSNYNGQQNQPRPPKFPFQNMNNQPNPYGYMYQNMPQPPKQPPMQSIMGYFQDKDGNLDFNKMMSTAGQISNTVKQVSPLVKQLGPLLTKFNKI